MHAQLSHLPWCGVRQNHGYNLALQLRGGSLRRWVREPLSPLGGSEERVWLHLPAGGCGDNSSRDVQQKARKRPQTQLALKESAQRKILPSTHG